MRILLAVDGSPCSDFAVAEVARLAWPAGTVVQVLTVEPPVQPPLLKGSIPSVFDEVIKQLREETEKNLNRAVEALRRDAPSLQVVPKRLEGLPKDIIIEEAVRWGADLIVVGSHGYGPIRRFFLGSVSLFVAHHAPCSVLIVRQPAEIAAAGGTTATAATAEGS